MRIIALDVRPDEKDEFERQAARAEVDELVCCPEPLTAENAELVRGFDAALILGMVTYDEALLAELAKRDLGVLVTRTIGTDHIDLEAARRLGIAVSNTSYAPDSVADFTLMLMLVALRKYKPMVYRQNVNDFSLPGLMGRTLSSLTVGVVGTGRIGRAVARRLKGFGAREPHGRGHARLGHRVGQDRGARDGCPRGRGRDLPRVAHERHHCQP